MPEAWWIPLKYRAETDRGNIYICCIWVVGLCMPILTKPSVFALWLTRVLEILPAQTCVLGQGLGVSVTLGTSFHKE